MKTYIIAIDGPAGAGKSTVCSDVARELGILHLDTGATYRTLALGLIRKGIDVTKEEEVTGALDGIDISIEFENGKQLMFLNGEDVTSLIRTNEISQAASASSVIGSVRKKLVQLQRDTAKKISMIVDGRDVGTCVFPDAQYKFYLTADTRERARRRAKQLLEQGVECDFEELVAEIEERDYRDMNRPISPLRRAEDAILIDCTSMNQQEVVQVLLLHVKVS